LAQVRKGADVSSRCSFAVGAREEVVTFAMCVGAHPRPRRGARSKRPLAMTATAAWRQPPTLVAMVVVAACAYRPVAAHGAAQGRAALLVPDTFDGHLDQARKQRRPCLVMFHVSWCKVCQRAFPKFANASDQVYDKGIAMDFAHVDCTDDKTLCQRYDVKGYPSIKLFLLEDTTANAPRTYKGLRNEEHFIKYAERMTLPAIRTNYRDAAALVEAVRNEHYSVFVAAVAAGGKIPSSLAAIADTWMDRHLFVATPELQRLLPKAIEVPTGAVFAAVSMGLQQWPGRDAGGQTSPAAAFYDGSMDDSAELSAWVERNRFPGIWMLDEGCFFEFTHANRSTVMIAFNQTNVTEDEEVVLRSAAKSLEDKFIFGVLDGISWAEELEHFNLMKKDLPRVLVTEDNFNSWVEDVDALRLATLEADLKALLAGAPLLWQDRGLLSKVKFYAREFRRFAVRLLAFGARGPTQAIIVAFGTLLSLTAIGVLGWLSCLCLTDMFSDGEAEYQRASHKKSS